jgi:hypothetical protein
MFLAVLIALYFAALIGYIAWDPKGLGNLRRRR